MLLAWTASTATAIALAAHIRLVFAGFADVADLLPSALRIELYAIAFHLYSRAYSTPCHSYSVEGD